MADLFHDGFDHLTAADTIAFWGAGSSVNLAAGRWSGYCIYSGAGTANVSRLFGSNYATLTVGFACKLQSITVGDILFEYLDAGSRQIEIRVAASGYLTITRNGTLLATSTTALLVSQWYYLELKVSFDPSSGSAELRINGHATTFSGNTSATSHAYANQIYLHCYHYVDDFYCFDDSGAINNTFAGECRIVAYVPTADDAVQWNPNTGTNHACAATDDGDTGYNSTDTPGQADTFAMTTATDLGPILAIGVVVNHRKDDVGTVQTEAVVKSGGTSYYGVAADALSAYVPFETIWEVDPHDANSFTPAKLNTEFFGYNRAT
jgi:hypothetical protein